jgi:DNA uptake protein ComE-like DNA-binding protein
MDPEHPCRAWVDDRLASEAECMAYFLLTGDREVVEHFEIKKGDRSMLEYIDGSKREASLLEEMLSTLMSNKQTEGDLVNVNTASIEELVSLKGIGVVKAKAIVKARPFESVEAFLEEYHVEDKERVVL